MDLIALAMAKKYTDSQRIAYVADAEVILDVALKEDTDTPGTSYMAEVDGSMLEVGKTYTVTTDFGTFTAVCKEYEGGIKYIGNFGILADAEDTGESFVGAVVHDSIDGQGYWFGIFADKNYGSHMKIEGNETIHPIDPKYLPGVCLPVVEFAITADEAASPIALNQDQLAVLKSAATSGIPVVIALNMTSGDATLKYNVLASTSYVNGSYTAGGEFTGMSLTIEADDSAGDLLLG